MSAPRPGQHHPPPGTIALRPELPEDEDFLYAVYASTRADELAITGWDETARTAFLDLQFRAMRQGYRQSYPEADFLIVLCDGGRVGRLVVNRSGAEIRVVDVALLPEYRSQGIGTVLMRRLMTEAEGVGKPVRLRVLKDNPAHGFYQRLGFRRIADYDFDELMEWERPPKSLS